MEPGWEEVFDSVAAAPSNPKSPLGQTLVLTFEHDWFVGSSSTGKGVHVSHHIGRRCAPLCAQPRLGDALTRN